MQALKVAGFFDRKPLNDGTENWRDHFETILRKKTAIEAISYVRAKFFKTSMNVFLQEVVNRQDREFYIRLSLYIMANLGDKYLSGLKSEITSCFEQLFETLVFLRIGSADKKVADSADIFVSFSKQLEEDLYLGPEDNDFVFMRNSFTIKTIEGKTKKRTIDMIYQGGFDKNGKRFSSVARTVAYPTAIAAQLILDGKFAEKGVVRPEHKDLNDQVYAEVTD